MLLYLQKRRMCFIFILFRIITFLWIFNKKAIGFLYALEEKRSADEKSAPLGGERLAAALFVNDRHRVYPFAALLHCEMQVRLL